MLCNLTLFCCQRIYFFIKHFYSLFKERRGRNNQFGPINSFADTDMVKWISYSSCTQGGGGTFDPCLHQYMYVV